MKPFELLQHLAVEAGYALRPGLGSLPLAKAVGKPGLQSQIYKFLNGRVKEPERATAEPLAALFNIPTDALYNESLATSIARERGLGGLTPSRELPTGVAQSVSLPDGKVSPTAALKLHQWGDLVKMEPLPDVFDTQLPDDAMAPDFPEGMHIECQAVDSAKFGELVILRTRDGNLHFRRLQQVPGGWIGQRDREGFMTIEPERDGARIVAVMTAYTTRVRR